ncbi:Hypothetical protein NocV09_01701550 [Nannochloropsis oceanica]
MPGKHPRPPVHVVVAPSVPSPYQYKQQLQREKDRQDGGSRNSSSNSSSKRPRPDRVPSNPTAAQERAEFKKMWKSVMDLGATQLTGHEKKAYEARRIVELGGKAPTAIKTPFNILIGKLAKHKHRDARRDNELKESGVVVAKKRQSAAALASEVLDDGGRRSHDSSGRIGDSPYPVLGKMKGGMLYLNRETIQTFTAGRRGGGSGGRGRGGGRVMGGGRGRGRGGGKGMGGSRGVSIGSGRGGGRGRR